MVMNKPLLLPAQYGILWKTSWITSLSALCAIYNKKYIDTCLLTGIFFTSINFWRYPNHSWRRTLDMSMVSIGILYQTRNALSSKHRNGYMLFMGAGITSYCIGCQHYTRGNYWMYVYHHVSLHVLGNIANGILCL